MEYLSACYKTHFRLWVGGEEKIVPARWYFTEPDAPLFPHPIAFCSDVYAKPGEESAPGPGEISRARVWDKGDNPGYIGECYLGEKEWFATGQLPKGIDKPPQAIIPVCCKTTRCAKCFGGKPFKWRVVAAGFSGQFTRFNGTWDLVYQSFCSWRVDVDFPTGSAIALEYNDSEQVWGVGFEVLFPFQFITYEIKSPLKYNCKGPNTFPVIPGPFNAFGPTTVTLTAVIP